MNVDFVQLMDPKTLRIEKSESYFEDDEWSLEPKINGRRMQCLINQNCIEFAGRYARDARENISDFSWKLSKIVSDLKNFDLPCGTLVDGEVHLPGQPVSLTLQILNSSVDDAITIQEQYGFLQYTIFDIMFLENKSLQDQSLSFRRSKLKQLFKGLPLCNIELINWLITTVDKKKYWQKTLNSNNSEKGVVFKFIDSNYESKRSQLWKKLKSFETYDAIIMGFKLHNRNPDEFVASIRVGQYMSNRLIPVANVCGLTKEQAYEFRSRMKYYEGKVIQFKSEQKTKTSYKNPRFDMLRPDKKPQSCRWED